MKTVIAIAAAGEMGSAFGQRLQRNGATVLTSLAGRSAASIERATRAGMADASDSDIGGADFFLSIAPPKDAVAIAERYGNAIRRSHKKLVYLDCNAISVETSRQIADIVAETGARYVDASIIGTPGRIEDPGPTLYLSGEHESDLATLCALGLRVRSTHGPLGAASALKMAYAGLSKGVTGLAAAMVLAATRAGAAEALHQELAYSQPQLLERMGRTLPDMYAKAYRWEFEMREIAAFAAEAPEVAHIFEGMADLFASLAADWSDGREAAHSIDSFLSKGDSPKPPSTSGK